MDGRFLALTATLSTLVFGGVWALTAPGDVAAAPDGATTPPPASVYYAGCREARAAGAAPIERGEPGYREEMDGDGDGVACEDYGGGGPRGFFGGRRRRR